MTPTFEFDVRIAYADTDRMGVVYYGNYFTLFERGRTELMRSIGLVYRDLEEKEKVFLPVSEATCKYLSPAHYDDLIRVVTIIKELGGAHIDFEYKILSTEGGKLLATGFTRHPFVNTQWKPVRVPEINQKQTPSLKLETLSKAFINSSRFEFETSSFPSCPHFGICGGCSIQNLSYPQQLQKKEALVREQLKNIPIPSFLPILASPEQMYYRNKMEYSFGDETDIEIMNRPRGRAEKLFSVPTPARRGGLPESLQTISPPAPNGSQRKVHLGLHPKGRFSVTTPTPDCFLLSREAQQILEIVSDWATQNHVPVYVRKNNEGVLRHLVIREGKNTGERLVNLVATSQISGLDNLAEELRKSRIPIATFLWSKHDGLSDVARGTETKIFWGNGKINEKVGQITIEVSPHTFMQTNTHAAEMMIDLLKSSIGVGDTLLDLYCGTGVLGLNLVGQFMRVKGVESEPASVESAKATAEANGIIHFSAQQGQVENLLSIFAENKGRIDACIVDPPRAGLHRKVVECLVESRIPTIIYVSCNPESLSRDLQGLKTAYIVDFVQPMDFFPHTDHVETMVKLHAR